MGTDERRTAPPARTPLLLYWGVRGGGARYTYELARALLDVRGSDERVAVSIQRSNELRERFEELAAAQDVDLDVRDFRSPWSTGWRSFVPGRMSLRRQFRSHGGPVVITMGNPLSAPVAAIARASRCPLVVVVHDGRPHLGERTGVAHRSIEASARLADRVVVLSDSVRDELVARWRIAPEKIRVIEHGPFYAEELRAGATRRTDSTLPRSKVLFFGRIRPYKGLGLLLDAWPEVAASVPGATLLVAGEGDLGPDAERLDRLPSHHCDALGAALDDPTPGVRIVNRWLDDAEIIAAFTWADVVVLPYLEASQSGVVGIAHAAGARVVSTGVGGVHEQLAADDVSVDATATSLATGVIAALTSAPRPSVPLDGADGQGGRPWQAIAEAFRMVLG